jgi:transcriptional regulator with XRE-family HTH domain
MQIGQKLRELREERHLSQGDIEQKTGLLRCYVSRVENGYTVPNIETLEKFARALDVLLYRFFTDGERVSAPKLPKATVDEWQINGIHRHELRLFAKALSRMDDRKQKLLLDLAQRMAHRRTR